MLLWDPDKMYLHYRTSRIIATMSTLLLSCIHAGIYNYQIFTIGKIHYNTHTYQEGGRIHYTGTQTTMRSLTECAMYCHTEDFCNTVIYESDGDCFLIRNFTDTLDISTLGTSSNEKVLELRTGRPVGTDLGQPSPCPIACEGTSVCLLDLSNGLDSEGGCVDIYAVRDQYENEGCEFQPYISSREYFLSNFMLDSATNGQIFFSVTFYKEYDWSALRVKWRGTLRGGYSGIYIGQWGEWRIIFNNTECTNPGHIEARNYNHEADTQHYKATGIHGICYELPAGTATISLYTESVNSYMSAGYGTNASRLYVDEIAQQTQSGEPAVNTCSLLPSFNLRESVYSTLRNNDIDFTFWTHGFTKMEDVTALQINVDFNIRLCSHGNNQRCVMWHVHIDGEDCSPTPFGRLLANMDYSNEVHNEHRNTEVEGHCTGISAGYHTMSMYIDSCPHGNIPNGDVETGWGGVQRFITEEIRLGTTSIGALTPDLHTMYRHPQFNMEIHTLTSPEFDQDEGVIWNIPEYRKVYSSSGLRLTLSAEGRCYSGHGDLVNYSYCCRHYFEIDGAECGIPGTIEGIHHLNKRTNLHRPIIIEGICEGIEAGTIQLTLNAGICITETKPGDCMLGWNSYVSLMVSESYVDRTILEY